MLDKFKEYVQEGIDYLGGLDTKEITIKNSYLEDKLSYYKRMLGEIEYFQSNYEVNLYTYKVDFLQGLSLFGQVPTHYKTVEVTSDRELSDDEIKVRAYKLVGAYPKSHTVKIHRVE